MTARSRTAGHQESKGGRTRPLIVARSAGLQLPRRFGREAGVGNSSAESMPAQAGRSTGFGRRRRQSDVRVSNDAPARPGPGERVQGAPRPGELEGASPELRVVGNAR
jgi:hypothetical protein